MVLIRYQLNMAKEEMFEVTYEKFESRKKCVLKYQALNNNNNNNYYYYYYYQLLKRKDQLQNLHKIITTKITQIQTTQQSIKQNLDL